MAAKKSPPGMAAQVEVAPHGGPFKRLSASGDLDAFSGVMLRAERSSSVQTMQ
jgi:hypothetical protein